jgi:hypothetical protein
VAIANPRAFAIAAHAPWNGQLGCLATATAIAHYGVAIRVDTAYEILVNELCALLGRSELRNLVEVRALLDQGFDLARALADAPKKDSGFSPVTLAWVTTRGRGGAPRSTCGHRVGR